MKNRNIENQIGVGLTFVLYAESKGTLLLRKNRSVSSQNPRFPVYFHTLSNLSTLI